MIGVGQRLVGWSKNRLSVMDQSKVKAEYEWKNNKIKLARAFGNEDLRIALLGLTGIKLLKLKGSEVEEMPNINKPR